MQREANRRRRLRLIALALSRRSALFLWYRILTGQPLDLFQLPSVDPLYLMPILFFSVLILMVGGQTVLRRLGRRTRSTGPSRSTSGSPTSWASGHVRDEVVDTLNLFLSNKDLAENLGGSPRRGVLFEGPPGTGKTYTAKALAAEAGVPFLFATATGFHSTWQGGTQRKIRKYFRTMRKIARKEGGAIGFIDEFDAIGMARAGVELVDEPDRAALLERHLAQRPEVGADLPGCRTLEARVEGRAGGEQERHARLGRERLRGVGLAGTRRALEHHPAAGPAPEVLGQVAVGQEQVQRVHDLVADRVDADDVGQPDVELLGPVQHVRRAHADGQRDQHAAEQRDDEQPVQQAERVDAGKGEEVERVAGEDAAPQQERRNGQHHRQRREPLAPQDLALTADIGRPASSTAMGSRAEPCSVVDTEPPAVGPVRLPNCECSPRPRGPAGRSPSRRNKCGRTCQRRVRH